MLMRAGIPGTIHHAELACSMPCSVWPQRHGAAWSARRAALAVELIPLHVSYPVSEALPTRLGVLIARPSEGLQVEELKFSAFPHPCNRTSLKPWALL